MTFPIILPIFDQTALAIGPLEIRWYSLAYIAGILFVLFNLKKYNKIDNIMSEEALDNWIVWAILGVVIGGRLGYVLFYNFSFYISHPTQIMAVWHGGMSFHGGLIGAITSMYLFCRKYKIQFFQLTDILAMSTPIGLFFGRIANFINMELYGRITNSNYGFIFPNIDYQPRHPSQLYEAALEGLVLFAILFLLNKYSKIRKTPGILSGLFLIGYAAARASLEQFREPDEQIGFLFGNITMGQILSLPIFIIGLAIIIFSLRKAKK